MVSDAAFVCNTTHTRYVNEFAIIGRSSLLIGNFDSVFGRIMDFDGKFESFICFCNITM